MVCTKKIAVYFAYLYGIIHSNRQQASGNEYVEFCVWFMIYNIFGVKLRYIEKNGQKCYIIAIFMLYSCCLHKNKLP